MSDRIRADIIRIGKAITTARLVVAAGGNIAARTGDDRLWVTPTGWSLADLDVDDLAAVSAADGSHVSGPHAATSELPLHLAAFRVRPDVSWSLHAHPPMATMLDALGIPIRRITTDHAYYLREIATVPYLHPGSSEVAEAAAAAVASGVDIVLLRHHGCLVLADDPQLLLSRALNLEAAAVATYCARQVGDDVTACPPEFLEHVRADEARGHRYGRHNAAFPLDESFPDAGNDSSRGKGG